MAAPTGTGFVQAASRYIGTPYVWGGESPHGFDCSGLVEYVLTSLGVKGVPRTSEEQYRWAHSVAWNRLQAGDLVFMNFPGEQSPGHVMIYAGRGRVIQAPSPGQQVQNVPFRPQPIGSSEWGGKIVGYGRVPGLSYAAQSGDSRAGRPPRPGNAANPGGAADAGQQAADAADAMWARYSGELSPSPDPKSLGPNYAVSFFGWTPPGLGWVPQFLDPLDPIPGVPGLDSWNPFKLFSEAGSAVSDVSTFVHWIAWLFSPRNILRVVEFLAGAGLIAVGLAFARSDSAGRDGGGDVQRRNPIGRAARGAFNVTPIGREVKVAKAATLGRKAARAERVKAAGKSQRRKEATAFSKAKAASRKPSETRDQHKRRRQREREQDTIPF